MNRETITKLYNWHLDKQSVFPGLSLEKRSRQAHTSEQKLWSLGFLIDSFLVPHLLDETHFDENLSFEGDVFVKSLDGIKLIQGALLRPHTAEYFIVAGVMEDCAEIGENARNSRLFLQACRCEGVGAARQNP